MKSVQIWSFFWSVFPRIRTEYGEILRISQHSVRMQENTDQKKTLYLDTYHAMQVDGNSGICEILNHQHNPGPGQKEIYFAEAVTNTS